jgi:hypothetical protein
MHTLATMVSDHDRGGGPDAEQDLVVELRLGNRQMGTATEREAIAALASELEAAVLDAGAGEYDGDEIGGGEALLFFCGPDAEALRRVLLPLLKRSPLCRGAHLVQMVEADDGTMVRHRTPV